MIPLEIPIFGPTVGGQAVTIGASRLELNAAGSYLLGGTTPTVEELRALVSSIPASTSVRVMIRPRGPPELYSQPDFVYSTAELETMRASILQVAASGLLRPERGDGLVFGILRRLSDGRGLVVDQERNAELIRLAGGLPCVFHRAFDHVCGPATDDGEGTSGWSEALDRLVACGFKTILTSGGPGRAVDNTAVLRHLIAAARGKVEIIVGGGVRSRQIDSLVRGLDVSGAALGAGLWFHSSCIAAEDEQLAFDHQEASALVDELGRVGGGG